MHHEDILGDYATSLGEISAVYSEHLCAARDYARRQIERLYNFVCFFGEI